MIWSIHLPVQVGIPSYDLWVMFFDNLNVSPQQPLADGQYTGHFFKRQPALQEFRHVLVSLGVPLHRAQAVGRR